MVLVSMMRKGRAAGGTHEGKGREKREDQCKELKGNILRQRLPQMSDRNAPAILHLWDSAASEKPSRCVSPLPIYHPRENGFLLLFLFLEVVEELGKGVFHTLLKS